MSDTNQLGRTIDACRRAGLPVVEENQCACGLRGRLVVIATPDGLRVLWPYDGQCPVHGPKDCEGPWPAERARIRRPHSPAAPEAWPRRKAGIP